MTTIKGECRGYDGPNNMVLIHTEHGNDIKMYVPDWNLQEELLDKLFQLTGVYNWKIVEGNVVGYERA